MKTSDYKKLKVWEKSMDLAVSVYGFTKGFPKEEIYVLTSQIRRCAVSIPSNIAEGHGRNSKKEFYHFLTISRGSIAELETQVILSYRLNYISDELYDKISENISEIDKMITGLMKYLTTDS